MTTWTVSREEDGLCAEELLKRRLPTAPGGYLRQLLRKGKIRRAGTCLSPGEIVHAGERLNLPQSRRLGELIESSSAAGLPILLETREILVIDKPAGLAVHRGIGHEEDNLLDRVRELMKLRRVPFRTAPVHRLDLETSGPVIFGKGRAAAKRLGQLFMADEVEKTYLALVSDRPEGEGELLSPVPMRGKLKEARTRYRLLAGNGDFSLLELAPQSGRTHQIRRQLAEAGHPVAGDRRYGGARIQGQDRLFLHCCRLRLTDPFNKAPLVIESSLPSDLAALLGSLGLSSEPPTAIPDRSHSDGIE